MYHLYQNQKEASAADPPRKQGPPTLPKPTLPANRNSTIYEDVPMTNGEIPWSTKTDMPDFRQRRVNGVAGMSTQRREDVHKKDAKQRDDTGDTKCNIVLNSRNVHLSVK